MHFDKRIHLCNADTQWLFRWITLPLPSPQKDTSMASTGRICLIFFFFVEKKSLNIFLWFITNLMVSKDWKPHHLQHISMTLLLLWRSLWKQLHSVVLPATSTGTCVGGPGHSSAWPYSLFLWASGPWAFLSPLSPCLLARGSGSCHQHSNPCAFLRTSALLDPSHSWILQQVCSESWLCLPLQWVGSCSPTNLSPEGLNQLLPCFWVSLAQRHSSSSLLP